MPQYLILKSAEPQDFRGETYASSLDILPGSEELLMDTPDGPIKVREMDERQSAIIAARPHIKAVELDQQAHVPEPIQVAAAEQLSTEAALALMGVDKLHAKGVKGKGIKAAVIDSGCGPASLKNHDSRIFYKGDATGEGVESPDDCHGEWCFEMMLAIAPEADYAIIKGLGGSSGSGTYSGLINCVQKAVEIGVDVISNSWGGPYTRALNAAVAAAEDAGIIVNNAAGNDQRGSTEYKADEQSPANEPKSTTVAAARSDYVIADFSSWGKCVDISAPGQWVKAPDVANHWSGTSMSCPCIAGVAVLLRSTGNPKERVRYAMYETAIDTGEPVEQEGAGFIQADAAYEMLQREAGQPAPKQPTRIPVEELKRISINGYDRASNPEKIEMQDIVLAIGRARRDFAVVRLLPPYWKGGE